MTISLRTAAAGTGLAAAGTTIAITLPTTIAANDIIFLFVATGASTGNLSAPAFTEIVKVQAQSRTIWLAYKVATGSEGGTSVTVTDTNSNVKAGGAVAFFGTEAGAPVFGFDPSVPTNGNGQINASSTTIATPQATLSRDCSRKVWFGATSATTAGGTPPVITRPASFVSILTQVNATSGGNNMGVHIGQLSGGAAGPSGSVDGSAASACVNGGIFLALAEKPCANDFEVAPSGTALSTGNTGGRSGVAFDGVTIGSGATLASDSSRSVRGGYSVQCATGGTAAQSYAEWNVSATPTTFATQYVRFYVYVASLPTITTRLLTWFNALTTQAGAIIITASTGKLATLNGAGSTVQTCANALVAGQWARVEAFCLGSATVGQLELKLFLTPDAPLASPTETITSAATQNTAGAINAVRIGQGSAATVANYGPVWFDAFYVREQVYPGPAPPGVLIGQARLPRRARIARHRHLAAFR